MQTETETEKKKKRIYRTWLTVRRELLGHLADRKPRLILEKEIIDRRKVPVICRPYTLQELGLSADCEGPLFQIDPEWVRKVDPTFNRKYFICPHAAEID